MKDAIINEADPVYKAAPLLLDALKKAKEIIHAWHGDIGWDLYQHSPEMTVINNAIGAAGVQDAG